MGLRGLCLLFLIFKISSATKPEEGCKKFFVCDANNSTIWRFADNKHLEFTCQDNLICNHQYYMEQNVETCSPCTNADTICDNSLKFTCDGNSFKLDGDTKYPCPNGFSCNENKGTSCEPCISSPCELKAWTCSDDDPAKVSGPGWEGRCLNGVCKKDKVAPCNEMCISIDGGKSGRASLYITKYI